MANKRPKPEEIVTKLRQVEVLTGHCHVNRLGPSGSSWQVVQAATTSCHSANAAALNAFKVGREIR